MALIGRRTTIYARNKSDKTQPLTHPLLKNMVALSVAPSVWVPVTNGTAQVPAGAIFFIPMAMWNQSPCAMNLQWTEESSEEAFWAAMAGEVTSNEEVAEEPQGVDSVDAEESPEPKVVKTPRKRKTSNTKRAQKL